LWGVTGRCEDAGAGSPGGAQGWYGGFSDAEFLGDKGAHASDATRIPPILARGVLIDVARHQGEEMLAPGVPIGADELSAAAADQGVEIRVGDVVLVRTGQLRAWPEVRDGAEAGLSLDGAQWLSRHDPLAIGADNSAVEVLPSTIPGSPQPVHVHLLARCGIYLLEWLALEDLAEARPAAFLFVCLPLKIAGATGSLVRPIAVL